MRQNRGANIYREVGKQYGQYIFIEHIKRSIWKVLCTKCNKEYVYNLNKIDKMCDCEKTIICIECGKPSVRVSRKKRFCSQSCGTKYRNKNLDGKITLNCLNCKKEFKPINLKHIYCCNECKNKHKYISGRVSTEAQYAKINGNWRKYLQRLRCISKRKDDITLDELMEILEKQNYKCALSGVDLTCNMEKGKYFSTNVSVDRIIPGSCGGLYTKSNIQLVCVCLNKWRIDMPTDNFISWCNAVSSYNKEKLNEQKI